MLGRSGVYFSERSSFRQADDLFTHAAWGFQFASRNDALFDSLVLHSRLDKLQEKLYLKRARVRRGHLLRKAFMAWAVKGVGGSLFPL